MTSARHSLAFLLARAESWCSAASRVGPVRRSSSDALAAARAESVPIGRISIGSGSEEELGPASEVRPTEDPASLVVETLLRGREAESSWLTVTSSQGAVCFEGPLPPNGTLAIMLGAPLRASRVFVTLEADRWHRQAEVSIGPGENRYTFN